VKLEQCRCKLDLCGPLKKTALGNTYIMVCIDHCSKWVELIPIPNKSSAVTSQAFLQHVLTDQGTEFQGDFQGLLERFFVDHIRQSATS
jgi:hypothetical protein